MLPDAVTLTPVIESDFAVLHELGRRALWLQVNKKNAAASRFYRSAKSTGRPMKGRPITAEEFERMVAVVPSVVGDDQALPWRHYLRGLWASGLRLGESLDLWWDRTEKIFPVFPLDGPADARPTDGVDAARVDRHDSAVLRGHRRPADGRGGLGGLRAGHGGGVFGDVC